METFTAIDEKKKHSESAVVHRKSPHDHLIFKNVFINYVVGFDTSEFLRPSLVVKTVRKTFY